jgi:excisionase family DNA binding protein
MNAEHTKHQNTRPRSICPVLRIANLDSDSSLAAHLCSPAFSADDAASSMGVARSTVYRWVHSHRLPALKFENAWRVQVPVFALTPSVA